MHGGLETALRLPPLAVLAGVRTPFAKAFGALRNVPADQLGRVAVEAALHRAGLQPGEVDELVFGNVAGQPDASNIGRVVALRTGIPQDRIAHTVNRNCASGMEAVFSAWQILTEGRAQRIVAGGTESMSNVPLLWNRMRATSFWNGAGPGGGERSACLPACGQRCSSRFQLSSWDSPIPFVD